MNRLRHPVRAIREPFGTAGLIVACIAIVLALTGAAFAAKGALTSKQKKEVEKIAKKFAGKPGPAGPAGPAGAAGSQGPAGPPGANGKNGKEGPEGQPGSPWTAGGTLPSGSTETGTWGLTKTGVATGSAGEINIPISFNIPLEAPITESVSTYVGCQSEPEGEECVFHVFEGEHIPRGCTGIVASGKVIELGAEPGNFCAYVTEHSIGFTANEILPFNPEAETFPFGVGRVGTDLTTGSEPAEIFARGYWAVTAK